MDRSLPTVMAALALALGAWNAWSLWVISGEITRAPDSAVEVASAAAAPDTGAHAIPQGQAKKPRYPLGDAEHALPHKYAASPDAADGASADVDDPVFREKVASVMAAEEAKKDEERRARFEESMRTEVTAFADEEDLDEATTTALLAQMAERSDAFRAVRDDVRSGAISWTDGRAEMEEMRESGDAELEKLLGAERAERLQTRLWGDRDGRGGPPPWGGGRP